MSYFTTVNFNSYTSLLGSDVVNDECSREIFGESQARLWWEENRLRIQQQYL